MATVIKESFVESNNHTEVLFQTDKPLIDFELNEAQRIPRVNFQRLLEDAVQKVYSGEDFSPGSNDDGFKPTPGGANRVDFAAGSIIMQGVRARVAATFRNDLAYGGGGTATYAIYARIAETEVADPAALQTLGETTRRRKLSITLLTVTSLGAVPPSSTLDLWEGGVHYEALCTVVRRSGDSSVLTGDITDLRRLLPSSVLTQIHRQNNFAVKAVVAKQFEGTTASPLVFVSRPDVTAYVPADNDTLQEYYTQSTFGFGPQFGFSGVRYATTEYKNSGPAGARYVQKVGQGGTKGVLGSGGSAGVDSGSLGFVDSNIPNDAPIDLSDSGAGTIRVFEKGPAYTDRSNILKALNGRWGVSCGDNTSSFGDFSGVSAISDAFAYFLANVYNGTTRTVCHLKVKAGVYVLSSSLTLPAGATLSLEGEGGAGASDTVITYEPPTLFDAAILVQTGGTLLVDKCVLSSAKTGAAYALAISSAGDVFLENCLILGSVATGAHVAPAGAFKRQIGLHAKNTHFIAYDNIVSDQAFCFAPAGSGTEPGLGHTQRVRHLFENCTFVAAARGSIIDVRGNLATENYIDELKFVGCTFQVAYNHTTESPAGILTCYSTSTNGGYMTVRSTVFEDCRVARSVTNKASPIVFDLRAANVTDSDGVGVFFDHIHMRNCDWRVLEDATRVYAPWHLGLGSPAQDLGLATEGSYAIRRLTIERTLFGFMNDGTNPDYTNVYGKNRREDVASPYRAALSLHAEDTVIRDVEFTGALGSSNAAEIFLPNIHDILVDGFLCDIAPSSDPTKLPYHRFIAYSGTGNDRNSREKGNRVFRRVKLFAPFNTTALTVYPGMVSVVPGGNMLWEDCLIQGGVTDTGVCIDPLEAGPLAIAGNNWDYSGFVLRNSTLSNLRQGFQYRLPDSGTVSQIEDIELDGVRFHDIQLYMFNFTENNPAGSAEYFTRIFAKIHNCVARYDEVGTAPKARFYAGRPWTPTRANLPYNLILQNNHFGFNSTVLLGATGSIFVTGLSYFVQGNNFSVDLLLHDATSLSKTFGLHTGWGSVGVAMDAAKAWNSGSFMLANSGVLTLV